MAWRPPESDRVEAWEPPADDAPQDSTVAQRQQAARTAREARAPSWTQAFAPSTSAALASGKNPLQDAATLTAPLKDLAALPANIAAGALGFLGSAPGEGGLATREAMAGAPISPYAETQNQRVVGGLALAGTALGAPFLRAVPAATQVAIPEGASTLAALASRGGTMAKNAGRLVGAGVVESAPAAAYQAATGDVGGGLASLALGGALRPLSGLPKAAPAAADVVERTAGALSGVPGHELAAIGPMGMSAYGREVKAAAGNPNAAYDLGQKLVDRMKNFDQYLPNAEMVDEMVSKLPPIDSKKIIATLENAKTAIRIKGTPGTKTTATAEVFGSPTKAAAQARKGRLQEVAPEFMQIGGPGELVPFSNIAPGYKRQPAGLLGMDEKGLPAIRKNPQVIPDAEPIGSTTYTQTTKGTKGREFNATPEGAATDAKIDQVISLLNQAADKDGNIPAYVARMIKQQYDAAVGDAFGKESSAYISALKSARHDIAKSLEAAAEESGIPEYALAMKDYTRKYSALDKIADQLGGSETTRRARAESFVSNLYGKNKAQQQKNMADLADILGEDFAQQAKAIGTAKVAMPGGALPIFPTQTTGRSMLGLGAAGSLATGGGALAGAPIAALSSPMLASMAIPAARGLANFATSPTADRATLASLASLRAYLQAENARP